MPTFHPPLAHLSEVVVCSDGDSSQTVQLTFSVTLDGPEDIDGEYQLWTDLPNLDASGSGSTVHPIGEWHEIGFKFPPSSSTAGETSSTSPTFTLSALPSSSNVPAPALYAVFTIPASPATYSYTLRHAKSSGEIIWLGSGGNNGTIVIKEAGEGEAKPEVVVEAGKWNEPEEDLKKSEWTGVAIALDNEHHTPTVIPLPTSEQTRASLVVGLGVKPVESLPFSRLLSPGQTPPAVSRQVALAISSSLDTSIITPPSLVIPETEPSATSGKSTSGNMPSSVKKALAEQSRPAFTITGSSDKHIILTPSTTPNNFTAYSVILAQNEHSAQTINLDLPPQLDNASPILLQLTSSRTLINPSSRQSSLAVKLEEGLVAQVLRYTEFSELRGAGSGDSIWICAPNARTVQIGEEEILDPSTGFEEKGSRQIVGTEIKSEIDEQSESVSRVSESEVAPSEIATSSSSTADDDTMSDALSENGTISARAPLSSTNGDHHNDTDYEAEDEDDDTASTIRPVIIQVERFWLFRMIDSLFYGFWSWLLKPFKAAVLPSKQVGNRAIANGGIATDGEGGQEQEEHRVTTPITERTPLLSTPGLSRSPSTTDNSALGSPESSFTIRPSRPLDLDAFSDTKSSSKPSTNEITASASSDDLSSNAGTIPIHPVKIRSYTQFTFSTPPPFIFYVPAQSKSDDWEGKVEFSLRQQGQVEWAGARLEKKGEEGGVMEVVVAQEGMVGEGSSGAWDVQVERL